MRQSQLEIKSIEAELRSIRADTKSSQSVSLLEAGGSPYKPSLHESLHQFSSQLDSIAPTVVCPSNSDRTGGRAAQPSVQPKPKRAVECFPISTQSPEAQDAIAQAQLENVIEQLRHYSQAANRDTRSRQSTRRQASRSRQTPRTDVIRQRLEEKAKQINELSTQQEAAILELMQISGQLNQGSQEADTTPELKNELTLECETAEIPYVERSRNGMLVLTNRSIEARTRRGQTAKIAKSPVAKPSRQRNNPAGIHWTRRIWRWVMQPVSWLSVGVNAIGLAKPHTRRQYRGSGRRAATSAPEMPVTLTESATLVVGAALLRILLNWLVISYPMLWIPSVLVMITPAAFAIYRATIKPPTGFAWGYRLFAILIGLLLGGRL